MSHSATIQVVKEVKNHPNADKLDLIYVLGWQCVSAKGNFKTGDKCIYIEIDSVCPDLPVFAFLSDRQFRIRTIRLRGELSQGLCLPISDFPIVATNEVGEDVSEILGVTHYEKPIPTAMQGETKGGFPSIVPKTDEERLQNYPAILDELKNNEYYITVKADGTSCTISHNQGDINVCSRNLSKKDTEHSLYWTAARKYNIVDKLLSLGRNIAIQGEVVGPGIQRNRLGLSEVHLLIFDAFDIDKRTYLGFADMMDFCKDMKLETVEIMETGETFAYDMETLLQMAKGRYRGTSNEREGIVVRSAETIISKIMQGRLSFKVLNNDYLLKDED